MCNSRCLEFIENTIEAEDIYNQAILEVGSYDVNGSPRRHITKFSPRLYLGVDIRPGPGVDEVCKAEMLVEHFGIDQFDMLISTEVLEHVADWKQVIHNMKQVVRPGGTLIITTRSIGFPQHDFPADYWRYEPDDIDFILGDCAIDIIERDLPTTPGIFTKARKKIPFIEVDLTEYQLYSMQGQDQITAGKKPEKIDNNT